MLSSAYLKMAVAELKFEDYLSRVPTENQPKLRHKIESDAELAKIAHKYTKWEETGPYLRLTATDEEDILNNRSAGVQRYTYKYNIVSYAYILKWYCQSINLCNEKQKAYFSVHLLLTAGE